MNACPTCGKEIPADQLDRFGGTCPDCLLGFAAEEDFPTLPDLEIKTTLGRGGMGVVYRAMQVSLGREVAVKVLSPNLLDEQGPLDRFGREAEALGRLQHANIVTVHSTGIHEGIPFLVMQLVEGGSLRKAGHVSPARAIELGIQICDALEYAHGMGVVHRDIKPENILLGRDGTAKIVDFGLAKLAEAERLTLSQARMGTPAYMAPEQIENPRSVDHRVDLYALGVLLYELLTGELPIGRFKSPSAFPGVPRHFDPVVLRLLEKSPDVRYGSAAEVREALKGLKTAPLWRGLLFIPIAAAIALGYLAISHLGKKPVAPVESPKPPVVLEARWSEVDNSATRGGVSASLANAGRPAVAVASDGAIVLAWHEGTAVGAREVCIKRWQGRGWQVYDGSPSNGSIAGFAGAVMHPALALDRKGNPVVAWHDNSAGVYQIYLRRWTGSAWEELGGSNSGNGLSATADASVHPTIALDAEGNPIVAWYVNLRGTNREVYLRRWDGTAWVEVGRSATGGGISSTPGQSYFPTVALDREGAPWVAWQDNSGGEYDIFARRWDGQRWAEVGTDPGGVSSTPGESRVPVLKFDEAGTPTVAWEETVGGNKEIYFKKWTGSAWVEVGGSATGGGVSSTLGESAMPSLALDPAGHPAIAWAENVGQGPEIYLRRWNGEGWEVLGSSADPGGISRSAGASREPWLAIDGSGNPIVAWQDNKNEAWQIYLRRWIPK